MSEINKAYSQIVIKAVDEDKREIRGIASTPSTDRMGDIVEPSGAEFKLPVPLLWQHDHSSPIGNVTEAKITKNGIEIVAKLVAPSSDMPNGLQSRLAEAWSSIKTGLVRGLSIGFSPTEYSFLDSGGVHFLKWNWTELSAVTIPANADASITAIKSLAQTQVSSDNNEGEQVKSVGVPTIKPVKIIKPEDKTMEKSISEQIKEFESTRAAKLEEMQGLVKSVDGRTFDAQESEQYDNLEAEIGQIEKHVDRLKKMEKHAMANAKPAQASGDYEVPNGRETKSYAPAVVSSIKNEEPGIGFAKFALSMFAGKGEVMAAKGFAENVYGNDKRLQGIMKAAVAAGTTTSPTWAGNLVDYQNLSSEFIDFLRPRTIVGQFGGSTLGGVAVPALRRVPFNVRIPGKTSSGTAKWVGEGARKPVTSSGYEATTLGWSKIAAISVVTDELARFSDPSILQLVRDDLADAVIERMDEDFIDPAKAAGTGVSLSPASITNGVTPITSSGNDSDAVRADINSLWAVADSANLPTGSAVYITDVKTARALSMLQNPLGQPAYASMTPQGGSINGTPVIVSNYVPSDSSGSLFILAFASEIYLADDGVVNIAYSREATIVMDDDPNATVTAAMLSNMFQENKEAIRAERYVHWKKRRPQAVAYLNGVNWGASA